MIIEKIKANIKDHKLFKQKERVLICVSGGTDSVFLLHALAEISAEYQLKISVAHLNHCLRGAESDADQAFVAAMAEGLGMAFFSARVEVDKLAKNKKMSIEQAARFARYNFFVNICKANKIKKIILAHTKDDQVETILMRMLRGTGIKGLGGMKFLSEFEDMLLARPLLNIEKKQILNYLKKKKLKSRIDSSNLRNNYFRNRIRLELIPHLEKLSPALKDNIVRIGENAQKTDSFLQVKLKPIYQKLVSVNIKNEFCFKRDKFLKLMPIIRSELVRKVIFALNGDLNGIDCKHINLVESFIAESILKGQFLDLPKSIQVYKTRQYVKFLKKVNINPVPVKKEKFSLLKLGQEIVIKSLGYSVKAVQEKLNVKIGEHVYGVEYLDLDKIKFPLTIRARLPGDTFKPLGATGKKNVKKFFIDQKIDRQEKENIPLILSDNKVIQVGALRISDDYKVTKQTKRILKITIRKIN